MLHEPRAILNGIFWALLTEVPWKDLPERYTPYQTCHRWFQRWRKKSAFDAVLIDLAEYPRKRGKGTKVMPVTDTAGFPFTLHVANASPHEVVLVKDTLEQIFANELPSRLIGGKAYDSDQLDAKLEKNWGIEMIAPNRKKRAKTQDGRPLRRYRCRWKVERLSAWLQNFWIWHSLLTHDLAQVDYEIASR